MFGSFVLNLKWTELSVSHLMCVFFLAQFYLFLVSIVFFFINYVLLISYLSEHNPYSLLCMRLP